MSIKQLLNAYRICAMSFLESYISTPSFHKTYTHNKKMVSCAFIIPVLAPCSTLKWSARISSRVLQSDIQSQLIHSSIPQGWGVVTDTGLVTAYKWQKGQLPADSQMTVKRKRGTLWFNQRYHGLYQKAKKKRAVSILHSKHSWKVLKTYESNKVGRGI